MESDRVIPLENWQPEIILCGHQLVDLNSIRSLYYQGTLGLVSRKCITLDAAHAINVILNLANRFKSLEIVC